MADAPRKPSLEDLAEELNQIDRPAADGRTCGACTECCTALIVDELKKPEWFKCLHLGKYGCRIYSKRPESCKVYYCMWMAGVGGRELRPDRLGIIFSGVTSPKLGPHILVHEIRPGAMEQAEVKKIISALTETQVVFAIGKDSMRRVLGGPSHLIAEIFRSGAAPITLNGEEVTPDVAIERLLTKARP